MEINLPDAPRLAALREALPATAAGIYLDTFTAGPLPAETARAMEEADQWDLRTGRAGIDRAEDELQRMEEARGVLAALVGGDPDDILLTHGVNDAVGLARELAGQKRLAVVEHVDAVTGAVASVEDLALRDRERALVVLDAGASAGVWPIQVGQLSVAFVALAGHRWLLGPEGTGALWINRRVLPDAPAGPMAPKVDPLPRRAVLGLARSVGWLEMYVGLPWIHERTARLGTALRDELRALKGVTVLTPAGATSAIVSLRIAGWSARAAAQELGSRIFAILGAPRDADVLRISFGAFSSEEELNRLVETVALLAQHTPETLPHRAGLSLLSPLPGGSAE